MILPREYEQVNWYGRGPHENYWDRKTSAFVGKYEMKVKDLYSNYIRPQENGNRTDVRWIKFQIGEGAGIEIQGIPHIDFNAYHNYMQDFDDGIKKISGTILIFISGI